MTYHVLRFHTVSQFGMYDNMTKAVISKCTTKKYQLQKWKIQDKEPKETCNFLMSDSVTQNESQM